MLLISIDTLRADRLPAYGYGGVETPSLDRFRRDAILYRNAYSPCPMTLPSHVTMFTGQLPPGHGVRNNVGFVFDGALHPSLPRLLARRDYATGAAVSSYVLRGETGLAAIFDEYEDSLGSRPGGALAEQKRPGSVTVGFAKRWIAAHAGSPFFYFFHIYEPHVPYDPPEPFRSRYKDAYDAEIATADGVVGDLLDHLRRVGAYDRSIIVVTSDHGEGLGDHGEDQHSILLYLEAIRVPLLLKLPGGRLAGRTVEAPAQLVDLLPTMAGLVEMEEPKGLPGRSLLHLEDPGAPLRTVYAETLYPRLQLGWSELRSLIEGQWHYIHGPRPELYDIVADPGEKRDLIAGEVERGGRMRAALERYPSGPLLPGPVDTATAERLAALGYVGTARERALGALPNPRDSLPYLERLRRGFRLAAERRYEAAAAVLSGLARDNPGMVEAWMKLGEVLQEADRPGEAAAALGQALDRSPVLLPDVALALGHAELRAGRLQPAAAAALRARSALPTPAHELLARVALARNRLDEAEREAAAALEPGHPQPSSMLLGAEVKTRRGDFTGALAVLEEAQGRARALGIERIYRLEALRADALARLGRAKEAEVAYRREIAAFPGNLVAHANLAALLFSEGRRTEVDPLLEEMAAANPNARARGVAATVWEAFGDRPRASAWRARAEATLREEPP